MLNTTTVSNGFISIYLHGGLIIFFLAVRLQLYAKKKVTYQCEEMVLHYMDTAPDGKILMVCVSFVPVESRNSN
jgi:hypothetical protein